MERGAIVERGHTRRRRRPAKVFVVTHAGRLAASGRGAFEQACRKAHEGPVPSRRRGAEALWRKSRSVGGSRWWKRRRPHQRCDRIRRRDRQRHGRIPRVAIFMRGIPVLQIPTTLLAQVDAAIGGKTGVNLVSGKNLIGSFPSAPRRPDRPGRARNPARPRVPCRAVRNHQGRGHSRHPLFEVFERRRDGVLARDRAAVEEIVAAAVRMKAEVVSADEREGDLRRILELRAHVRARARSRDRLHALPPRGGGRVRDESGYLAGHRCRWTERERGRAHHRA